MMQIPLSATRGPGRGFALVDDEDYERFGHLSWTLTDNGQGVSYAMRRVNRRGVFLHRAICECTPGDGLVVDHKNGNGLDNQRSNLRVVTTAANGRNRRGREASEFSSRYRGVDWSRANGGWRARARIDKREYSLGTFAEEEAAARAVEAFWLAREPEALLAAQAVAASSASRRSEAA